MTPRIADRGDMPALTAGFRPAPTAGPQDPPVITGPWCPRGDGDFPVATDPALDGRPPVAAFKECGCGVLKGEDCDCDELAAQHAAHLARPLWLDLRRAA